jgi:hypothetical protein
MKIFYRFILIISAFILAGIQGKAQPDQLRGKILDAVTGKPVAYAGILNYSRQITVYTNADGEFAVEAGSGDTLVFSAIGYYYQKQFMTSSSLNTAEPVKFPITARAYELSEARIVPLGTYSEFRQRFINLDQPKTNTEILRESLAEISRIEARDAYDMAMANRKLDGITFISVPILTPEEKERIALGHILEKEKVREQVYRKFNPEVVKRVTGMTGEDVIIEFMVFCDFSDDYLLNVNDYDLMVKIALKYEDFKRKRIRTGDPINRNNGTPGPNA